jgi:hypothetical protein
MDNVTGGIGTGSQGSQSPKRTRRGGKRIRFKHLPKPAIAVKGLWDSACEEDRERAQLHGTAILELWLGRKSKDVLAAELSMPPVRVWQMSQMALSGMLAGLLKQPRSWSGAPPPEPQARADVAELRKQLAQTRADLERERRLTGVLKQLASVKGSASTSKTTSEPGGKKRGTAARARVTHPDRPRAQRGARSAPVADEGGGGGTLPERP